MQIVSDATAQLRPGNFAARLNGNALFLPKSLVETLARSNVRTVEDFLSFIQAFAAPLASQIGWTPHQLAIGVHALTQALEGRLDANVLHPPVAEQRHYGVRLGRR